ncbi:hypothetical protein CUMW_110310 [Citrus unshiu]|nr:hypothetical protein CUMW_110310 [Citrus unshiu]
MGLEEDSGGADTGQFVVEKQCISFLRRESSQSCLLCSVGYGGSPSFSRNVGHFYWWLFRKLVEEEEGNCGLWLSYIFSGAAANFVPWLILPKNAVSVGAAGAVFGLFAISVLVKMSWDRRKVLEVLILDELVVEKAAQAPAGTSGTFIGGYSVQSINHIAILSGALFGVFLNKALNLREKRDKTL